MRIALLALALSAAPASAAVLAPKVDAARRLFESGRYAEVIPTLDSAAMQKLRGRNLSAATLYLAESYARTRRSDKALSVYQLGIRLFPKNIELLLGLARLYQDARLDTQADVLYRRVLDLEPGSVAGHLGLAVIDRRLGFLERSAQHYEAALERVKDDAEVWREYSETLYHQREHKTAELAIAKARALAPQNLDAMLLSAYIQRGLGDLPRALSELEAALALTGRPPDVLLNYALWLVEAGRFQDALSAAQEVLRGEPKDALALWVCGRARLSLGQKTAALKDLRAAAEEAEPRSFVRRAANAALQGLGAP